MIQRIQSLYLLIAAAATIVLMFIPIGNIYTDNFVYVFNAFVVKDITPDPTTVYSNLYLGILMGICAIFSIVAIFLYKKRNVQIRIIYMNMFIFLAIILLMLYVYPDVIFIKNGLIQEGNIFEYNYWILACLIPTAVCFYLANKAVKKDEELVRSADRLR